jgi:hypothetical protein
VWIARDDVSPDPPLRGQLRRNPSRYAPPFQFPTCKAHNHQSSPASSKAAPKEDKTAGDAMSKSSSQARDSKEQEARRKKTAAELDEELRLKLEGISGEGGTAGVEYEGGKAVGLKRGVKDNMFRVI